MSKENYRPRLSIELPLDLKLELDTMLGGWRVKNALYTKITIDLVKVMKRLSEKQRRLFIVAIVEGHLKPEEYLKTVRKVIE